MSISGTVAVGSADNLLSYIDQSAKRYHSEFCPNCGGVKGTIVDHEGKKKCIVGSLDTNRSDIQFNIHYEEPSLDGCKYRFGAIGDSFFSLLAEKLVREYGFTDSVDDLTTKLHELPYCIHDSVLEELL
jgi:hypothetical protein